LGRLRWSASDVEFFAVAVSIWCLGAWVWLRVLSGDAGSVETQVDRVAFGDFYRLELDAQVRRPVLLLGSNDVANDVVHDAFIAVYRRWGTLDEPGPYMHMSVLNGCRGIHRQRSRQRRLLPRFVDRGAPAAVDEHLDDLLAELPFNQRAAVVLRFCAGLTAEEIARELGYAGSSRTAVCHHRDRPPCRPDDCERRARHGSRYGARRTLTCAAPHQGAGTIGPRHTASAG
jgi:DNA-directed RNA polymerase specialized sigma24 family protein